MSKSAATHSFRLSRRALLLKQAALATGMPTLSQSQKAAASTEIIEVLKQFPLNTRNVTTDACFSHDFFYAVARHLFESSELTRHPEVKVWMGD